MSNNNIEPIKCPACLLTFDTDKHLPRISPACGHTLCKECLVQALKMDTPRCPLDKLKFGKDFRTIEVFPTNFLGKDLLEIRGKWNICESHQEQQKMICLTDHTLVCGSCVLFGAHKGHNVKKLEHFEGILNQKKSQLLGISERVSEASSEFTNDLDEKKKNMKKTIKNRFQSLYAEIQRQELSMLLELENMFCDAEIRLRTSLDMPFDIENKLREFDQIMINPNIAKLAEEDFSDLDRIIEEKLVSFKAKHTEEIAEILNIFQNNLPKEDLLKDLDLNEPLNQEIAKFMEKKIPAAFETKEIIIPPIELKILKKSENDLLTLSVRGSDTLTNCTLPRADLEEIKKINYDFEFDNDIIDERIFSTVALLSRSLKNLKTVEVCADAVLSFEGPCEAKFFHLLSAVFSQLNENLEEIEIYVKKASVKDLGLRNFIENLLPRFKNLTSFSLNLIQTETTSKTLQALNKVDFSKYSNLKKFHVNVRRCPLDEESVTELLNKVPNVQDLRLWFVATPLTDKTFDSFSTDILPSLTKVKSLFLGFWETNITDEGTQKLLNNMPNAEILDIDISSTKITDAGVRDFVNSKLPSLTNLKDFELNLKETQVSKSLLDEVRSWERKFKQNEDSEEEKSEEKAEEEEEEEEGDEEDDDDVEQEEKEEKPEKDYNPFRDIYF